MSNAFSIIFYLTRCQFLTHRFQREMLANDYIINTTTSLANVKHIKLHCV